MVKDGQAAGIVESDASTPVDGACGLVVQLIISLEDILHLILWDSLACISHRDGDNLFSLVSGTGVERYIYLTATRGKLHGVGHQVVDNLFQFVGIQKHQVGTF